MESIFSTFVIQGLHGLAYGCLLFLVAAGLTLVFGMMGVLNIAHPSFYMLGAYFSYQMLKMAGNFWVGLIVCPLVVGLIGIIMERFLLRRVHAAGPVPEFVITFGIYSFFLPGCHGFFSLYPDEDPPWHYGPGSGLRPRYGQRPGHEYALCFHAR